MRHVLPIAVLLSLATVAFAADNPADTPAAKPAEKKAAWLVESTTNPVSLLKGRFVRIKLKITNNTDAEQTLNVPRFWECHCDNQRMGFGGWTVELRGNKPGHTPGNSVTQVKLAAGESYRRSWNWMKVEKDSQPEEFTFRLGLVINGKLGDEPVWSSPISVKAAQADDKPAEKK